MGILWTAGTAHHGPRPSQQEIDHQPDRKVLALLSGQDFGDDVAAWRRWVEQAR